MLVKPLPHKAAGFGGPTPSSMTSSATSLSSMLTATRTVDAPTWRATLLNASRKLASKSFPRSSGTWASTAPAKVTSGSKPSVRLASVVIEMTLARRPSS